MTTDLPDHPTGAKLGIADPKNRGLPASAHQIPVSTEQETNLVEITTEVKHVIRKKVFLHQEKNLIRADRNPEMDLYAAHRLVIHSHAEARKAGRKELLANNPVKRKAILPEGKCHIQVSQQQKADRKEALAVNHLKENLLVNQVSKAAKSLRIENSAAVRRRIRDINHFVNRLIHRTTNHHSGLNEARKTNQCAQGRNLQKNLA